MALIRFSLLSVIILGFCPWLGAGYGVLKLGVGLVLGVVLWYGGVGVGRWGWFCGALGLSWLTSVDWWQSFIGVHGEHEGGVVGWLLAILVLNAGLGARAAVINCGVLVSVWSWLQAVGYGWSVPVGALEPGRAHAGLGGPVYLGAYLGMCVPLVWGGWRLPVILTGLWLSGSRGGMLGALVGVLLLKVKDRRVLWALAVAALAGFLLLPRGGVSDRGRLLVWKAAGRGIVERALTGWGPDNFVYVAGVYRTPEWDGVYNAPTGTKLPFMVTQSHAHNLFLEILCTLGVLGLCGFLYAWRWPAGEVERSAVAAVLVSGLFNPLSLAVRLAACSLCAFEVKAGPRERWFILAVLLAGVLAWGKVAAHDRSAAGFLGRSRVWEKSQTIWSPRELRILPLPLEVDRYELPDLGGS